MFPFDYGTELVFDYGHLDAELIFHRRLSSCIVGMLLVSLQFLHTFLHVKPSSRLCCHGYPFILHILMENLGHYLFFFYQYWSLALEVLKSLKTKEMLCFVNALGML